MGMEMHAAFNYQLLFYEHVKDIMTYIKCVSYNIQIYFLNLNLVQAVKK